MLTRYIPEIQETLENHLVLAAEAVAENAVAAEHVNSARIIYDTAIQMSLGDLPQNEYEAADFFVQIAEKYESVMSHLEEAANWAPEGKRAHIAGAYVDARDLSIEYRNILPQNNGNNNFAAPNLSIAYSNIIPRNNGNNVFAANNVIISPPGGEPNTRQRGGAKKSRRNKSRKIRRV